MPRLLLWCALALALAGLVSLPVVSAPVASTTVASRGADHGSSRDDQGHEGHDDRDDDVHDDQGGHDHQDDDGHGHHGDDDTPTSTTSSSTSTTMNPFDAPPTTIPADDGVTRYPVGGEYEPWHIAADGHGSLWYTAFPDIVGRVAETTGDIDVFHTPSAKSSPGHIVRGPDGAMWFSEPHAHAIGRIDAHGNITEYPIWESWYPQQLIVGPDGALWFLAGYSSGGNGGQFGNLGRLTVDGEFTPFQVGWYPRSFASGSDGHVWVYDTPPDVPNAAAILRVSTAGTVESTHRITPPPDDVGTIWGMTAGPGGAMFFSYGVTDATFIGRMMSDGEYELFNSNNVGGTVFRPGVEGEMWLSDYNSAWISRVSPTGRVTKQFSAHHPGGTALGVDGNLWYTEGWPVNAVTRRVLP